MTEKLALAAADGLGDGLIASILAHNLRKSGRQVTVFNPHLLKFGKLLEEGDYQTSPQDWAQTLRQFDAVILQHEDTPRAKKILSLRKEGIKIYVIYTNYRLSKHGPLEKGLDYPANEQKTLVANMEQALFSLFSIQATSQNSLTPHPSLHHRKQIARVLIHPMSGQKEKNWLQSRFLKLANKLEKEGFEPMFILSPEERSLWPQTLHAPLFETLESLAVTVYESGFLIGNDSGPAHLASYYQIPHLVIGNGRNTPLWSPGWHPPSHVLPPRWIPNIKWFRFREKHWKYCITTTQVLKTFKTTC